MKRVVKQKRIALINDVTGFGRCSVAVQQPIISAMKIQACALPTAILSTHTKFLNYRLYDFTENMLDYMENWEENKLSFDGICTGFLGSKEQIEHVITFFKKFKKEETFVIVDPVMGDSGVLYNSYTIEMASQMKKLIPFADLITPNLTEACILTGTHYDEFVKTQKNLEDLCYKLSLLGPQKIVITGIELNDKIVNCVYESKKLTMIYTKKIGEYRTGTGDIFTAIVGASLVRNREESLIKAVKKAVSFINKALEYTVKQGLPLNYGVCFEEYLDTL